MSHISLKSLVIQLLHFVQTGFKFETQTELNQEIIIVKSQEMF